MAIPNNDNVTTLVTEATEFNALQNIIRKKHPHVLMDLNGTDKPTTGTYAELTVNSYIVDETDDVPYHTVLMVLSNSTLVDGGSGNSFTMLEVVDYLAGPGSLVFNEVACTMFGNMEPGFIYAVQKTDHLEYTVLDVSGIASRLDAVETYANILEGAFPEASQTDPTKLIMNGTRNILQLTALIVDGVAAFNNLVTFNSPVTLTDSITVADPQKIIVGSDTSGVVTVDSVDTIVANAVTAQLGEIIITSVLTPEEYELDAGEALPAGTLFFQVSE